MLIKRTFLLSLGILLQVLVNTVVFACEDGTCGRPDCPAGESKLEKKSAVKSKSPGAPAKEKEYLCGVEGCEKKLAQKSVLETHMATHVKGQVSPPTTF